MKLMCEDDYKKVTIEGDTDHTIDSFIDNYITPIILSVDFHPKCAEDTRITNYKKVDDWVQLLDNLCEYLRKIESENEKVNKLIDDIFTFIDMEMQNRGLEFYG